MHTAFDPQVPAGIELVEWPSGDGLRRSLARAGIPRLLLVEDGTPPPPDLAFDEDWVRSTTDVADVRARAERVLDVVRAQSEEASWLDQERVLHRGRRTAVLSASEAVVAEVLLSNSGQVVSRTSLQERLWPAGGPPSDRAVDAVVYRLRRRLRDLGLMIRSARGQGFVLLNAPMI